MFRIITLYLLLVSMIGCSNRTPYNGYFLEDFVGQEVVVCGTFGGPGMQADYVTTKGEPVYLTGDILKTADPLEYGADVEVKGVLKFKAFTRRKGYIDQVPPDYYYLDHGSIKILRQPNSASGLTSSLRE